MEPTRRQHRTLAMVARDLFGSHATDVLSGMLALNPRSVSRWLTGQGQFPPPVIDRIREVLAIAQRNLAEQQRRDIEKAAERE